MRQATCNTRCVWCLINTTPVPPWHVVGAWLWQPVQAPTLPQTPCRSCRIRVRLRAPARRSPQCWSGNASPARSTQRVSAGSSTRRQRMATQVESVRERDAYWAAERRGAAAPAGQEMQWRGDGSMFPVTHSVGMIVSTSGGVSGCSDAPRTKCCPLGPAQRSPFSPAPCAARVRPAADTAAASRMAAA